MKQLPSPETEKTVTYVPQGYSVFSKVKFSFFAILTLGVIIGAVYAKGYVTEAMKSPEQRREERMTVERAKLPALEANAARQHAEAADADKLVQAQVNVIRGLIMSDCEHDNDRRRSTGRSPINCEQDVDSAFPTAG